MAYSAKVLLDSVSEEGARLTTMELTFWRPMLAEFNTHRMFSRNAASSRAIRIETMLARVEEDPAMPVFWGKNQKGMSAAAELEGGALLEAQATWLCARDDMVRRAKRLLEIGLHKQIANRLLEDWCWATVIATATDWNNFFWLRCHADAQPEIRRMAALALVAYHQSQPQLIRQGEWHLPFIQPDEWDLDREVLKQLSSARCARITHLTHEGIRDTKLDVNLYERLKGGSGGIGHWSPLEHPATPLPYGQSKVRCGNFTGWGQHRKEFAIESHSEMSLAERIRLIEEMHELGVLVEGEV